MKANIEKIYKELDKLSEGEIVPTFTQIKDFLHKKLISVQEEAAEKANQLQENINQLK